MINNKELDVIAEAKTFVRPRDSNEVFFSVFARTHSQKAERTEWELKNAQKRMKKWL